VSGRAPRRPRSHHQMSDLYFTLGAWAFFALALTFAGWLDRLDTKETP
jgi:hypothetical protein